MRRTPQLVLELVDPRQQVGTLERVRRSLEHQLVAVDAGQLLIDDGRGAAERVIPAEEVDVVGIDPEPEEPE